MRHAERQEIVTHIQEKKKLANRNSLLEGLNVRFNRKRFPNNHYKPL